MDYKDFTIQEFAQENMNLRIAKNNIALELANKEKELKEKNKEIELNNKIIEKLISRGINVEQVKKEIEKELESAK